MLFAAQLALSLALAGAPASGLETLHDLQGNWTCGSGARRFSMQIAERHARPDQPTSPLEALAVSFAGDGSTPAGLRTGLVTYDARDGRLHFDAEGRCGQPAPIEDDDDPESGVQRCLQVTASAPATSAAPLTWSVVLRGEGPKNRTLSLKLGRAGRSRLTLTLAAPGRAAERLVCRRAPASTGR